MQKALEQSVALEDQRALQMALDASAKQKAQRRSDTTTDGVNTAHKRSKLSTESKEDTAEVGQSCVNIRCCVLVHMVTNVILFVVVDGHGLGSRESVVTRPQEGRRRSTPKGSSTFSARRRADHGYCAILYE